MEGKQVLHFCAIGCLIALMSGMTFAQNTSSNSPNTATMSNGPTTKPSTGTTAVPTTLAPSAECGQHNSSCDDCLNAAIKCVYCKTDDSCLPYHESSGCDMDKARWGVCWLNFKALVIACSVIGGVIVLTITICCVYCCCCRGNNKKKYAKEDAKYEQQKMERKARQDERRTERKGRLDEIRRKYGLVKDDAPYQRFDA